MILFFTSLTIIIFTQLLLSNIFYLHLHISIASSQFTEIGLMISQIKKDVICNGEYHFKINKDNGNIDSLLPPSNMICDIINGSLTFDGYNTSYIQFIPKSIKSIKSINGTLYLANLNQYPSLFSNVNQVGTFHLYRNAYSQLWKFNQINHIHNQLLIQQSQNVALSFPNLIQLGQLYLDTSSISIFDLSLIDECGSIEIRKCDGLGISNYLKNVKKINGYFNIQGGTMPSIEMDSLVSIKEHLSLQYLHSAPLNLTFANDLDIGDLRLLGNDINIQIKSTNKNINIQNSLVLSYSSRGIDLRHLGRVIIGNSIEINFCEKYVFLFDLSSIRQVNGSILIFDNFDLKYPSFRSLEYIRGDLYIPQNIKHDESLKKYFPKLKTVDKRLILYSCASVTNMQMLEHLDHVGRLIIEYNSRLTSLEGLEHLKSLKSVNIHSNYKLNSLNGLENLVKIEEELLIFNNEKLRTLHGLRKLESVGSLELGHTTELKSLEGLGNLRFINGIFELNNNQGLVSTKGLSELEYVRVLYIHLHYQRKLRKITFGKKGSNLGYPQVIIKDFWRAEHLTLEYVQKVFSSICDNINTMNQEFFVCNQIEYLDIGY